LQRWTKNSREGKMSWLERTNIGVFRDRQILAMAAQLQSHKMAFTSVVGIATLYSSIRNHGRIEEIWQAVWTLEAQAKAHFENVNFQLAEVKKSVTEIGRVAPAKRQEFGVEYVVGVERQLQEDLAALGTSQALLAKLLTKVQKEEIQKEVDAQRDHFPQMSFGTVNNDKGMLAISYNEITVGVGSVNDNGGMAMGVSHGQNTWNPLR